MNHHLAALLVWEAALFVLTMVLTASRRFAPAGEYAGIAFHLLLLPPVASISAPLVGTGSGFLWVGCDVIASTGLIWNCGSQPGTAVFGPIRMAGHLFAALWIASVSLQLGPLGEALGCLLALGFAGYTLAGGRLPEKFLAAPGLLLLLWLVLLAGKAHGGGLDTGSLQMHAPSPQAGPADWRKPA